MTNSSAGCYCFVPWKGVPSGIQHVGMEGGKIHVFISHPLGDFDICMTIVQKPDVYVNTVI